MSIKIFHIVFLVLSIKLFVNIVSCVLFSQSNFNIVFNKNIIQNDFKQYQIGSFTIIDKILCLTNCMNQPDCNLASYDGNVNKCILFNISSSYFQNGFTFVDSFKVNLYIAKSYKIYKPIYVLNGIVKSMYTLHSGCVNGLIQLYNGYLASSSDDMTIKIWNQAYGNILRILTGHTANVWPITELSNGYIASGSYDLSIKIWDINSDVSIRTISNAHTAVVRTLLYIPTSSTLASGSHDCSIKLWNINNGQLIAGSTLAHSSIIVSLILLQNGDIASGSYDQYIKIWDATNLNLKFTLSIQSSAINGMFVLQNGYVVTGYSDATIKIWSPIDRSVIQTINGLSGGIFAFSQLQNGNLVSGHQDGNIRIWNIDSGSLIKILPKSHNQLVSSLVLLSTGELVSASWDPAIIMWG